MDAGTAFMNFDVSAALETLDQQHLRRMVPITPPYLRKRPGEKLPGRILSEQSRIKISDRFLDWGFGPTLLAEMLDRADLELQYYLLSRERSYPTARQIRGQLAKVEKAIKRLDTVLRSMNVDAADRFYRYLGAMVSGEERPVFRLDAGNAVFQSLSAAVAFARKQSKVYRTDDDSRFLLYSRLAIIWPQAFKWSMNDLDKFNAKTTSRAPTNDVLGSSFVRSILQGAANDAKRKKTARLQRIVALWHPDPPEPDELRYALKRFGVRAEKKSRDRLGRSEGDEIKDLRSKNSDPDF